MIIHGDCLEKLKALAENSVDSIVTDPPYFLTNSSGSGFMGKEWDSLSVANAFAESLLKSLKPVWLMGAESSAQEIASIKTSSQKRASNITALYVETSSIDASHKLSLGTFSVLESVLTKAEVLALSRELCPDLTNVVLLEPKNVLYVIKPLTTKSCHKGIAQEIASRLHTPSICEELTTLRLLMAEQKKNDATVERIGSDCEKSFTSATSTDVKIVESIVELERYSATTSFLGDSKKIIRFLTSLRFVKSATALFTANPCGIRILSERFHYRWAKEALRVLKPGAHILTFTGTRTYHPLVSSLEDAGFEIRDQIQWNYGSGFPKSTNVLKSAIKQGLACECEGSTKLPCMREGISETEMLDQTDDDALLQLSMQRGSARAKLGEARTQGPPSKNKRKLRLGGPEDDGAEEPSMEGRSNLQAEQRELHRSKICKMSEGISSDGPQRQLHNGASLGDGSLSQSNANENGSCASQGSQHAEQLHNELRIICDKSTPQTCGSCGKTIFDPGLGTALKPANEPICLARKPLEKGLTVAANVLKWGTGAMNIDQSRIRPENEAGRLSSPEPYTSGRWPANIIFDEAAAEMLDAQAESVSRFFYCAKASKRERNAGLEGEIKQKQGARPNSADASGKFPDHDHRESGGNNHPTVKPIKLMEYLIKLITPPKGTVLDPFMGSGSTGVAAQKLGFKFIGIEREKEYAKIAERRLEAAV